MNIQLPSFLQKGDKVVIVSPSSKIDKEFLKRAKRRLESWGLKVSVGKYAGGSSGRYAGTNPATSAKTCRVRWMIRK